MKKIKFAVLTLALMFIFSNIPAHAFDILNTINTTLDTLDRIDSTYGQPKQTPQPTGTRSSDDYEMPNGSYENTKPSLPTGSNLTVKDLPQGTFVIDPNANWDYRYTNNYYGDIRAVAPVFWQVYTNNHFAPDTTLLVSKYGVAKYDFNHQTKGLTAWKDSDVRRFLRTTFYKHLSQGFRNSIVEVQTESVDTANKPYKILDNVFLLSIVEWNLSDRKNNGKAVDYKYIQTEYMTGEVFSHDEKLAFDEHPVNSTLTRTINCPKAKGFEHDIFIIEKGILDTSECHWAFQHYLRPAVNIKSTTRVKGPYKMDIAGSSKKLTYYALDFSQQ